MSVFCLVLVLTKTIAAMQTKAHFFSFVEVNIRLRIALDNICFFRFQLRATFYIHDAYTKSIELTWFLHFRVHSLDMSMSIQIKIQPLCTSQCKPRPPDPRDIAGDVTFLQCYISTFTPALGGIWTVTIPAPRAPVRKARRARRTVDILKFL